MNTDALRDGEKRAYYFVTAIQDYDVNGGNLEIVCAIMEKARVYGSKLFSRPQDIFTEEEYEIFKKCIKKIEEETKS